MSNDDPDFVSVDPQAPDSEWNQTLSDAIQARLNKHIVRIERVDNGWKIFIGPPAKPATAFKTTPDGST
jgi:hypothetical protein